MKPGNVKPDHVGELPAPVPQGTYTEARRRYATWATAHNVPTVSKAFTIKGGSLPPNADRNARLRALAIQRNEYKTR